VLELEIGQSVRSRSDNYYRVVQPIGAGKNAQAFLCMLTSSVNAGCFFALKVLQRPYEEDNLRRFESEVTALSRLQHPAILQIVDSGVFRTFELEYPFFLCRYYPETLGVAARRGLQLTRKLAIAMQLISGLAYLEEQGVVHCDVKPDNVFVGGFDCVLADFGLAKLPSAAGTSNLEPSLHHYRSPDLAAGGVATTKSDVFQLGLVLAELFTGKNICVPATNGGDPVTLMQLPEIHGNQSASIRSILLDMLCMNPANRPNASDVRDRWQRELFLAIDSRRQLDSQVF